MAYMAVGDLCAVEGGPGGWLGEPLLGRWASIETQPHTLSPPLSSSEHRQLSTSSLFVAACIEVCVNLAANVPTVTG